MAATYFKTLAPSGEVRSAGTHVPPRREGKELSEVPDGSLEVMKEIGFGMSTNKMHKVTTKMVDWADIVVVAGNIVAGPLPSYVAHSEKLTKWNVPDPGYGQISFEGARDAIIERVKKLAESLKRDDRPR